MLGPLKFIFLIRAPTHPYVQSWLCQKSNKKQGQTIIIKYILMFER